MCSGELEMEQIRKQGSRAIQRNGENHCRQESCCYLFTFFKMETVLYFFCI